MASWKKVIVSGSDAELRSLTINQGTGLGKCTQIISSSATDTELFGTFDGTHIGDGKQLTDVTGSKVTVTSCDSGATVARIVFTAGNGTQALCSDGDLTYNASDNIIGSNLSGNATTATTATSASNVVLTACIDGAQEYNVPFFVSGAGTYPALTHDITYRPDTDTLTVSCIEGTVSNATCATCVNVTDSDDSATAQSIIFASGTGQQELKSSGSLSFTPATCLLKTDGPFTAGGLITAANACITNDLNVAGDLIVGGDLAYLNVTNLAVEDQFILLASGSNATGDSGIIFGGSEGTAGSGNALFWDASYNTNDGRLSIANGIAQDATSPLTPAYSIAGVFEGNEADAATAQADHPGNIRIDGADIYIYS